MKYNSCVKKCGTITVSIYQEHKNNHFSFCVETDNESILPITYVIEDVLKVY